MRRRVGLFFISLLLPATPLFASPPVVLCADTYCPYNCEPGAEQPGYLIELATAAMASRNETIEYRIEPWERAIVDTRGGRCDALVGTPAGDPADFIFPSVEAGMNVNVFITLAASNWRYRGAESLADIVLGGIDGYRYGEPVDSWIAQHHNDVARVQLISGETAIDQNLAMLARGRTTAYLEDKMVLQYRAQITRLGSPWRIAGEASRLPFHIAFSPAKPESAARAKALASLIKTWRQNGQLKKLLARYGLDDWH
ncbi:ABC transporter substrate-binding protein [Permianibacter sp. IMCC34836]|uniref:substrate-binding periplasmic protein n=1 Tax=Permianibacter fluminis TaxID=2738515 RepID=UPI0015563B2C|nr:transporter substrate-binding domain-containing protein [Permianibacter fluminis]NQD36972.1 ABC transporter substrate-binding protein [Permianibacter fluminis]